MEALHIVCAVLMLGALLGHLGIALVVMAAMLFGWSEPPWRQKKDKPTAPGPLWTWRRG